MANRFSNRGPAINPITGQPLSVAVEYGGPYRPERRPRPGIEESKGEPVFLAPLTPSGRREAEDPQRPFLNSTIGGPADEYSSPAADYQPRSRRSYKDDDGEALVPAAAGFPPKAPSGGNSQVSVNLNVDQLIGIIFDLRSTLSQEVESRRSLENQLSELRSSMKNLDEENKNSSSKWLNIAGRVKELEVHSTMESRVLQISEQANSNATRLDGVKIQNLLTDFKQRIEQNEKWQREEINKNRQENAAMQNTVRDIDADLRAQVGQQMKLHDEQLALKLIQLETRSAAERATADQLEKLREEVNYLTSNHQVLESTMLNMRAATEKGEATEKDWIRTFLHAQLDSHTKQVDLRLNELNHSFKAFQQKSSESWESYRKDLDLRFHQGEEKSQESQKKLSAALKHSYTIHSELLKNSLLTIEKRIHENQELSNSAYNSLHNSLESLKQTQEIQQSLLQEITGIQNKLQQSYIQREEKIYGLENVLKTEIKTRIKGYQKNKALIEGKFQEFLNKREDFQSFQQLQDQVRTIKQSLDSIDSHQEQRLQLQLSSWENKFLDAQGKLQSALGETHQYVNLHIQSLQNELNSFQGDVKAALTLQHEFSSAQGNEIKLFMEDSTRKSEEITALMAGRLEDQLNGFKDSVNDTIGQVIQQLTGLKDQNQAEFDDLHINTTRTMEDFKAQLESISQIQGNSNTAISSRLDVLENNFNADLYKAGAGTDWRDAVLLCDERNKERIEEVKAVVAEALQSVAAQERAAREDEEDAAANIHNLLETRSVLDELVNHVEERQRHDQRRADRHEILQLAAQMSGELKAVDERLGNQEQLTEKHDALIEDFFVLFAANKEKTRALTVRSDDLLQWIQAHSTDIKTLNDFINVMHENIEALERKGGENGDGEPVDAAQLAQLKKMVLDVAKNTQEALGEVSGALETQVMEARSQKVQIEELTEAQEETRGKVAALQAEPAAALDALRAQVASLEDRVLQGGAPQDSSNAEWETLSRQLLDLQEQFSSHRQSAKAASDSEAQEMAAVAEQVEALVKSSKNDAGEFKNQLRALEGKVEQIIQINALAVE